MFVFLFVFASPMMRVLELRTRTLELQTRTRLKENRPHSADALSGRLSHTIIGAR